MLSMSYSRPTRRPLIASEAPPRPPLRHIIAASVAVSLPLMTLALISTSVSDLLFLPPIGAAMALIVGAPNLPLAQPRNVVVGHLIGCTTGIAILHMLVRPSLLQRLPPALPSRSCFLLARRIPLPPLPLWSPC